MTHTQDTPTPKGKDWNDLAAQQGEAAAAQQLLQQLQAALSAPKAKQAVDITDELRRYALVYGQTNVWDFDNQLKMKGSSLKAAIGAEKYKAWLDHPTKKQVTEIQIQKQKAKAEGFDDMFSRYVLIYGTKEAWDHQNKQRIQLDALKYAWPNGFDVWLKSEARLQIEPEQIVFDPSCQLPEGYINTFEGLPLTPLDGLSQNELAEKCAGIRQLLAWICGQPDGDKTTDHTQQEWYQVMLWVMRWLAYPLQRLGSKLDSALIFHGDVQGAGKSLFFDRVMRKLYGQYSATLGQHQLESQYTDWKSEKLYCVFEEIFSNNNKYSNMGTVKHHVTGNTFRVEKKFYSGWEEANYANSAFLSNDLQPLPIEQNDRRFLVVWPRHKLPLSIQQKVNAELDGDGIRAFYTLLLHMPLGDFNPHTQPPMTTAKQDLIGYGLRSYESFYELWQAGELPWPYVSCVSDDVFRAYCVWCERVREKPVAQRKFGIFLIKKLKQERPRVALGGVVKQHRVYIVPDADGTLTEQVNKFSDAVHARSTHRDEFDD